MTDEYKHQANYVKRQKEKGFMSIRVWIPAIWQQKLRDYAKKLRSEFKPIESESEEKGDEN
jgi:uncharacterized membrane protein